MEVLIVFVAVVVIAVGYFFVTDRFIRRQQDEILRLQARVYELENDRDVWKAAAEAEAAYANELLNDT